MQTLKIKLEDGANAEKLIELLLLVRGIKSVEIEADTSNDNDIQKVINKSKKQLKEGDYETFVNDLFEAFLNKK